MKAKLKKDINGEYFLEGLIKDIPKQINVYQKISETKARFGFGKHSGKLSKQNCEAIANGYDVYELAKENYHKFWPIIDESGLINHTFGYVEGFNKAMELNRFTLDDIRKAYYVGYEDGKSGATFFQQLIQSLNQPTEIEVEIEMESILVGQCNCPCHTNKGIIHSMACCNPKIIEQPKLDSSGSLILKKI
jgi:hypothetical protein